VTTTRWIEGIALHRDADAAASRTLLRDAQAAVAGVSRRYPAVYFELGDRNDEAVESLGHRVFAFLDGRVYGRFPFSDRTPFDTFVLEGMTDDRVRYHSFSARLSITREALREQYAFNVRHHPEWGERERLHKQVVAALKETCTPVAGRSPRWPRYALASWGDRPRQPRSDWNRDDVVRILARRGGWPVESRVQLVLAKRGAPMYPGAISSLLQEADVAHSSTSVDPDALAADSSVGAERVARLLVRQHLSAAWAALGQDDRGLLLALLAGRPYREIVEASPRFRDPSAVTRALSRVCGTLLGPLCEALGQGGESVAALRPQQQAELLFGALAELPAVREARGA
jgi:hypothetical protein